MWPILFWEYADKIEPGFQDVRQRYVNLAGGAFSKVLLLFPFLLNIGDDVDKKNFKPPFSWILPASQEPIHLGFFQL